MTDKMDAGKIAQEVHNKNVQARTDGGPGSGKKKGGGGPLSNFKLSKPDPVKSAIAGRRTEAMQKRHESVHGKQRVKN